LRLITIAIGIMGLLLFTGCANGTNGTEDQPRQHTLEELSTTIEAVGEFWNRWYASHHTFEWEHIDDSRRNWQPWDETITPAHHPLSRGFAIITPSSGFTSLNDIGSYLSQFYKPAWINAGRFAEPLVIMEFMPEEFVDLFGFYGFEEYDGELFVFIQTEWSARPDWTTATHTIIEQYGDYVVVETVVSTSINGFEDGDIMPTIRYLFTFIDGRIDSAIGSLILAG